jgi:hypothetical protein
MRVPIKKEYVGVQRFQHTCGTITRTLADIGMKERLLRLYTIWKFQNFSMDVKAGYWLHDKKRQIGSYGHAFPDSYARIPSTDVMVVYERNTNRWGHFTNQRASDKVATAPRKTMAKYISWITLSLQTKNVQVRDEEKTVLNWTVTLLNLEARRGL